jgi:hypothetical protein
LRTAASIPFARLPGSAQSTVAEPINVDRVTSARWKTGERHASVDAMANLAAFSNTSIEALLGINKRVRGSRRTVERKKR